MWYRNLAGHCNERASRPPLIDLLECAPSVWRALRLESLNATVDAHQLVAVVPCRHSLRSVALLPSGWGSPLSHVR